MHFPFTTQPAIFLARPNRYRIIARLCETQNEIHAHCPDPGRLHELLIAGVTVHVSPATQITRKTAYDLRFVEHPEHGQLISLDTRLPNLLFAEGLATGFFAPFRQWQTVQREVSLPPAQPLSPATVTSRIDFRLLAADQHPCWIEVKSATLVVDACAYFPDAPTVRGQRHVLELTHRVQLGERAAVVFIIQRPDAQCLRPNWTTDPALGQALVAAQQAGVEIYAYTCAISTGEAWLAQQVEVQLARP
jgi:sugar fermentation stimulation protein A